MTGPQGVGSRGSSLRRLAERYKWVGQLSWRGDRLEVQRAEDRTMFRSLRTVATAAAVTAVATLALLAMPAPASSSTGPTIDSFTPTSATVGTTITIDGSGLSGAT